MRKPAGTSHRGVTRQAVAEAAAGLVAVDGLEALSVRQVAHRLGVWPTTVMHHAGGRRDGLLALLIEHLAGTPDPARRRDPSRRADTSGPG